MSRSNSKLEQWGHKLDTGPADDPLLALAMQLQLYREPSKIPPDDFRLALRAKLLAHHTTRAMVRRWWLTPGTLATAGCLALLVFVLSWMLWHPAQLSAARIIERTAGVRKAQLQESAGVYERFKVALPSGSIVSEAIAERWQSADRDRFRYQLTDPQGQLLYFRQSDGQFLWRSLHTQRVGTQVVQTLLREPLKGSSRSSSSTYHDPIWFPGDKCTNIDCLLNEQSNDFKQLELRRDADGGPVYVVTTSKIGDAGTGYTVHYTLQIDQKNYALREVEEWIGGSLSAHLRQIERRPLTTTEILESFFGSVPKNLEVIDSEMGDSQPLYFLPGRPTVHSPKYVHLSMPGERKTIQLHKPNRNTDNLLISMAIPEAGAELQENTTVINLNISYELRSVPQAALVVMLEGANGNIVALADPISISSEEHFRKLRFPIHPANLRQRLGPGEVRVQASIGLWDGLHSFTGIVSTETQGFTIP